ncbi:hypothetical protein EVA_14678 [gut metagenome]|uniref:Uncharacterized protein n=1 Tax=gut metagenome TaxID=749906 RepID=J9FRU1_9ZZZZ
MLNWQIQILPIKPVKDAQMKLFIVLAATKVATMALPMFYIVHTSLACEIQ